MTLESELRLASDIYDLGIQELVENMSIEDTEMFVVARLNQRFVEQQQLQYAIICSNPNFDSKKHPFEVSYLYLAK